MAAVQDQPVVRVEQVGRRHAPQQPLLDRQRRAPRRQPAAVGDAKDMRVDGDRRLAESDVEDDVGGFAADPGQGLERLAGARHRAAMLLDEQAAGLDQVACLVAVQPERADVPGDAVGAEGEHLVRRVGDRKQPARGQVDAAVGGLRRQQHGDQQLERRAELEFGLRLRVGRAQRREEGLGVGVGHGGCRWRAWMRASAASTTSRLAASDCGSLSRLCPARSASLARALAARRSSCSPRSRSTRRPCAR